MEGLFNLQGVFSQNSVCFLSNSLVIGFIYPLTSDCKFSILEEEGRKGDLGSCYFVAFLSYRFLTD